MACRCAHSLKNIVKICRHGRPGAAWSKGPGPPGPQGPVELLAESRSHAAGVLACGPGLGSAAEDVEPEGLRAFLITEEGEAEAEASAAVAPKRGQGHGQQRKRPRPPRHPRKRPR